MNIILKLKMVTPNSLDEYNLNKCRISSKDCNP